MSSLRICLHRSWDRLDPSAPVPWSLDCLRDLHWWLHGDRFSRGVSLLQVSPVLSFWSDASDVGLGPHLGDRVVSGLWDQSEALLPVNARELLAVCHGLLHFQSFLSGTTVAVFCGNVTAAPYLLKIGGSAMFSRTLSPVLTSSPVPHGLSLGRISIFAASVAGAVRPVCHFRPSPLLHLFLALPRPSLVGDGRALPVLGRSPGVRFFAVVRSSQGVGED